LENIGVGLFDASISSIYYDLYVVYRYLYRYTLRKIVTPFYDHMEPGFGYMYGLSSTI
jgi:hypothetical protein